MSREIFLNVDALSPEENDEKILLITMQLRFQFTRLMNLEKLSIIKSKENIKEFQNENKTK